MKVSLVDGYECCSWINSKYHCRSKFGFQINVRTNSSDFNCACSNIRISRRYGLHICFAIWSKICQRKSLQKDDREFVFDQVFFNQAKNVRWWITIVWLIVGCFCTDASIKVQRGRSFLLFLHRVKKDYASLLYEFDEMKLRRKVDVYCWILHHQNVRLNRNTRNFLLFFF